MCPDTNKLEAGFHSDTCRTCVPGVEQVSQNGRCQSLCPVGELQLPPASPGSSPTSAGESHPSSFHITVLPCEILCATCVNGVSVSHRPLTLSKVSLACLQRQMLWGLVILVQDPQAGEPYVGLRTCVSWGRNSVIVVFLLFVGHLSWLMSLVYTVP